MISDAFISSPNLPQKDVTLCISSDSDTAKALNGLGIEVLSTVCSPFLANEVGLHPDMQVCLLGGKTVILDRFQKKLSERLSVEGFNVIEADSPDKDYPKDIRFNAAICGGFLFGLTDYLSEEIITSARQRSIVTVPVKQGYAKCSVCVIGEREIITDDSGIAFHAERLGFDVLCISKGDIFLTQKHYGFIGGCSGKISKDTVAFTGCLDSHRDGSEIRKFLKKHACKALELSNAVLKDVGSILPVKEEN